MLKTKVIIDTDIGDDIDDVYAIFLASNIEKLEILGITTVFLNAYERAALAKHFISHLNKNIPVYIGENGPLYPEKKIIQDYEKQYFPRDEKGIYHTPQTGDEIFPYESEKEGAIDFIHEMINKYPHEVCIAAIGPLTNIGRLYLTYPKDFKLLKGIYLMGGGFNLNFNEWNLSSDPEASKLVIESGTNIFTVGIDVTSKVPLSLNDVDTLKNRQSTLGNYMSKLLQRWYDHYDFPLPVLHDPLLISTLYDDYVLFEDKRVSVILEGEKRGSMKIDYNGGLIHVATDLNPQKNFVTDFMNLVKKVL